MGASSTLAAVDGDYRHVAKFATAGARLTLGSSRFKWYDIARAEAPVTPAVRALAVAYLEAEAGGGRLGFERDVGFIELHRCGVDFYFLIACSWRHANELWKSVFYKDGAMAGFAPWPMPPGHFPTYCVWELGPIVHEKNAWVAFLRSARDEVALGAYLGSVFEGEV